MTWADEPDTEHPLRGTYGQACSINCALRAQSLKEWVCRPHSSPPFYAPPLLQPRVFPISAELMPGYSIEVATQSHRRAEAARLMYKTMEEDSPVIRCDGFVSIAARPLDVAQAALSYPPLLRGAQAVR
jgi:hypothetical protein